MNKEQLLHFKEQLENRKKELEEELGTIASKSPDSKNNWESKFPNFDSNADEEENADEVEEYINRLPIERALEEELKDVVGALERIERSTYGKCENCEKNIDTKRLEAIPETKVCIDCENKKAKA